jgi:DNA-binding ferritin-like protein
MDNGARYLLRIRSEERDALGTSLQAVLVDLTDLALAGKQLHWNVVGPNFRPLHLQLDELVDTARERSDEVAERARALAWAPDGRRDTIASGSTLAGMPEGEVPDTAVVELAAPGRRGPREARLDVLGADASVGRRRVRGPLALAEREVVRVYRD